MRSGERGEVPCNLPPLFSYVDDIDDDDGDDEIDDDDGDDEDVVELCSLAFIAVLPLPKPVLPVLIP